jgi:hypothetical protein
VSGQGERGSDDGTSMVPVMRYENREGEVLRCYRFRMGRGEGGEAAPRCQMRTTQRRAEQRPGGRR